MKKKMSVEVISATSKAGKPYDYVQITIDGVRMPFLFIKSTEKSYYGTISGNYSLIKE